MIIWQGLGFLGAILPVVGYVLAALFVQTIKGPGYLAHHAWPGALGTLIGAGLVWLLGTQLERPSRTLVDQQTGEVVILRKQHTLFFIPLRYLAIVFAFVALGMLFLRGDSSL